ncbi:MAG: type II secretion system protein [Candidatus Colwellbacteria bacterium]|nr:type II secretion system protein [Candidatus Colwellbacteria bacterium]
MRKIFQCFSKTSINPKKAFLERFGNWKLEIGNSARAGFTLVELLIYAAIFAVASGLLTGILVMISNVQTRENAAFEVTRQLQFITQRIQYAIRDASIVDSVYEGSNPANPCSTYCTVKLRVSDPDLDPTIISSDVNGVYITEGSNPRVTITSPNVKITSLVFNKVGNPGGLSTVTMDVAIRFNNADPVLQIAKTLSSAIAHVSAATFDTDLLPDSTETRSIGGSSLKWKDLILSDGITISGAAGVGEFAGLTMAKSTTHGTSSLNEYYVTSAPYDRYGARFDVGGTPMLYLEGDINQSGRRAYILNGNVGIGTSSPSYPFTVVKDIAGNVDPISGFLNPSLPNGNYIYNAIGKAVSSNNAGLFGFTQDASVSKVWMGVWGDDIAGSGVGLTVVKGGNVGVGTISPGSYRLYVNGGDAYFSGDVSALSFTDRTPYPLDKNQAYEAVLSMSRLPDGEYEVGNKERQLDHSTLSDFVKSKNGERDLSATVSAQNEVIKDLVNRIEELEKKCGK